MKAGSSGVLARTARSHKELALLIYGGIFALATVAFVGAVLRRFSPVLMICAPPVMLVGGLGTLLTAIRTHEVLQVLSKTPERVAWIYAVHIQPSNQASIALGLTDGSLVSLLLNDRADEAAALAEAVERAPHAVVGFSPELSSDFFANPGGFAAKHAARGSQAAGSPHTPETLPAALSSHTKSIS